MLARCNAYAPPPIILGSQVFSAYLPLIFLDWAFKADFRIWVFAIKPMSLFRFKIVLAYSFLFAFYFLISGPVLHGQLRRGWKDGDGDDPMGTAIPPQGISLLSNLLPRNLPIF